VVKEEKQQEHMTGRFAKEGRAKRDPRKKERRRRRKEKYQK
jgi:hypothetical protein